MKKPEPLKLDEPLYDYVERGDDQHAATHVMMTRSRFLGLWFGLFWTGIFIGWVIGVVTGVLWSA